MLAPAIATYSWLQQYKKDVKKEVKRKMIAGIDKNQLDYFEFATQEINTKIRWEHAREFEYNSQMYDVVEKKTNGKKTLLWCWKDSEETILNQKLQKLFSFVFNHDSKSKDKENKLFSFYKTLYFQENFSWKPLTFIINVSNFSFVKSLYHLLYYSYLELPPEN